MVSLLSHRLMWVIGVRISWFHDQSRVFHGFEPVNDN